MIEDKQANRAAANLNRSRDLGLFLLLVGLFLASLILTNLVAAKLFRLEVGGYTAVLSCGIVTYPLTFLVTDLLSEIYGEKHAAVVVKVGFLVSLFTALFAMISVALPVAENSFVEQSALQAVLGTTPGIVFASMSAYLCAQFIDVRIYGYLRNLTQGRHLWLRNNGSTIVSQLVDTFVVVFATFWIWPRLFSSSGLTALPISDLLRIVRDQYGFKAVVALLDTPMMYLAVRLIKSWLDRETKTYS